MRIFFFSVFFWGGWGIRARLLLENRGLKWNSYLSHGIAPHQLFLSLPSHRQFFFAENFCFLSFIHKGNFAEQIQYCKQTIEESPSIHD